MLRQVWPRPEAQVGEDRVPRQVAPVATIQGEEDARLIGLYHRQAHRVGATGRPVGGVVVGVAKTQLDADGELGAVVAQAGRLRMFHPW